MIIQFIRPKSTREEDELMRRAREREPQFKAIPGLVQKYYVRLDEPGSFAGIYVWDSKESLMKYRESDLAKSIPGAYKVSEPTNIEVMDLLFKLRE